MKQNNFTQQTHFIGVLLPEDITLTLEDCRRYMREAYGCKSGHGTPIHVTLVPPFKLQEEYSTADLVRAIEKNVLPKGLGFIAHKTNVQEILLAFFGRERKRIFAIVIGDCTRYQRAIGFQNLHGSKGNSLAFCVFYETRKRVLSRYHHREDGQKNTNC